MVETKSKSFSTAEKAAMKARAAELKAELGRLLANRDERGRLGQAARQLVLSQQGATERTLDLIDHVLSYGFHKEKAA